MGLQFRREIRRKTDPRTSVWDTEGSWKGRSTEAEEAERHGRAAAAAVVKHQVLALPQHCPGCLTVITSFELHHNLLKEALYPYLQVEIQVQRVLTCLGYN